MKASKMQIDKLGILGLLSVILLLASCGQSTGAAGDAPTPTPLPTPVAVEKPTYTVERGAVVKTLEFTGRVSPVTEKDLFFKTAGYVREVFVARGDEVAAGDILAELEIGQLETQLAQAQVDLQTAETTLSKAEQDNTDARYEAQINLEKTKIRLEQTQNQNVDSAVNIAYIRLQQAQQSVADSQKAYDQAWEPARDWELYMTDPQGSELAPMPSKKEMLEQERESTERGLAMAQDSLRISQAEYSQALATRANHDFELRSLEQDLVLAEFRVEQLERGADPLLVLNVEKVKLEIERLEGQMADAQLVAPFDGKVLSLNIKGGSSIEAFKAAVIVGDPTDLEITAELGSEDLAEISVDQPATISLRSRPQDTLEAYVRSLPYLTSGSTANSDQDRFVRVALADTGADLELGELATVVLVLEQKVDVLWLPPAALRSFQGRDFVVIQADGRQLRVDVRLGIESDDKVEILEGVEAGQVIVGQ